MAQITPRPSEELASAIKAAARDRNETVNAWVLWVSTSTWGRHFPAAVDCLNDGFELLVAHLHYPRSHWPRIRHTNLV